MLVFQMRYQMRYVDKTSTVFRISIALRPRRGTVANSRW